MSSPALTDTPPGGTAPDGGPPRGHRSRWLTIALPVAVVVLVAVGTGVWAMRRSSADSTTATVTYRSTTVSVGTIKQSVTASGTIAAAATEDLDFGASGQVTAVYVSVGQQVAKGQRLGAISSASLTSQVAQAESTLASAQARLDTDEDADASNAQIAADKADVTVARAQLADAEAALAGATLTSPIAGTVTVVNVAAGQQVSGSGGSGGSGSSNGSSTGSSTGSSGTTSAFQVVSTGSYVVDASVDATDVALIAKGDQVVITPTGASAPVFGLVSSVGIMASTTSGVASFPVQVGVTGSPAGLYPGGTASLSIVYKQLSDVLVVPTLAVQRSGGAAYVLMEKNGVRSQRTITTGLSSGGSTQVLSGLAEGDVVLVPVPSGAGGGTRTGTGGTNPFTGGGGNAPGGNAPPVVVNGDGPVAGVAPDGGGATK